jgi:hypothetical protein
VSNANYRLENKCRFSNERPASHEEIEITEHLLEYFRILIEFDERDKSQRMESDNTH